MKDDSLTSAQASAQEQIIQAINDRLALKPELLYHQQSYASDPILHNLIKEGNIVGVDYLLSRGINLSLMDRIERTASEYAQELDLFNPSPVMKQIIQNIERAGILERAGEQRDLRKSNIDISTELNTQQNRSAFTRKEILKRAKESHQVADLAGDRTVQSTEIESRKRKRSLSFEDERDANKIKAIKAVKAVLVESEFTGSHLDGLRAETSPSDRNSKSGYRR